MKSLSIVARSLLLSLLFAGSAFAADQVNINTADAATLDEVLVNVGPSKAKAIVDYREANGAFRSAEQLALVKGIGLSTIEKNRDRTVVGGAGKKKAKATKQVRRNTGLDRNRSGSGQSGAVSGDTG